MFKITEKHGAVRQTQVDDESADEVMGTEQGRKAIITVLGLEKYHYLLAALYIIRADVNAMVRQSSVHVWKSIVSNTPKTLKEILSTMMEIIVIHLASDSTGMTWGSIFSFLLILRR